MAAEAAAFLGLAADVAFGAKDPEGDFFFCAGREFVAEVPVAAEAALRQIVGDREKLDGTAIEWRAAEEDGELWLNSQRCFGSGRGGISEKLAI